MSEWKRIAKAHDPTACAECYYRETEHPGCFRRPLDVCAHPDAVATFSGVRVHAGSAREAWCRGLYFKRRGNG